MCRHWALYSSQNTQHTGSPFIRKWLLASHIVTIELLPALIEQHLRFSLSLLCALFRGGSLNDWRHLWSRFQLAVADTLGWQVDSQSAPLSHAKTGPHQIDRSVDRIYIYEKRRTRVLQWCDDEDEEEARALKKLRSICRQTLIQFWIIRTQSHTHTPNNSQCRRVCLGQDEVPDLFWAPLNLCSFGYMLSLCINQSNEQSHTFDSSIYGVYQSLISAWLWSIRWRTKLYSVPVFCIYMCKYIYWEWHTYFIQNILIN